MTTTVHSKLNGLKCLDLWKVRPGFFSYQIIAALGCYITSTG